jgi:hypothetical protein
VIQTASGYAATLDGTSQGALTIAGTYQASITSDTYLSGMIINKGTISLNAGSGSACNLIISDGTMLTGGGNVILSDSPYNRIYGAANSGAETLTNVNNTISGAGQIGYSNSIEFINQSAGVINANSATNALTISPTTNSTVVNANGGGFVNQGLLEATAAGGLVLSGGQFNNTGGVILADGSSSQVQIVSNTSVTGGTLRTINGGSFSIGGNAAVDQITGTLGTITVTSTGALSATSGINFNGIDGTASSAPTNGGQLTLNITSGGLTIGDGNELNTIQAKGGAYNPSGPFTGGNGGTIDITAAGDVLIQNHATDHAGISATTGTVSDVTSQYAGAGGTVNITTSGQVTVDGNVKVSSDDAIQNGATGSGRESASGGTIDLQSNLTTGAGITVTSSGGLFSFLNANAPGPGGSITLSTKGANIVVDGTVEADRGTVDIENAVANGQITLSGATVLADIVKIGAFGTNGTLNIGGGLLSADTMLKLYAPSSNGTINFSADVTLGGASTKIIAGDTVNIFNGITVTIGGVNPASVFTNNANYTGSGGNGSTTGIFGGAGATTQPLSQAPAFGSAPSSPTTLTPAVAVNIQTSSSTTVTAAGANTAGGGQSRGPVMNFGNSAQLLSLLDAAAPGPNGQITIPFPKSTSKSGNSSGTNVRNRVNTRATSEDLLRVRDRKAIRPELNNPPPTVRAPTA